MAIRNRDKEERNFRIEKRKRTEKRESRYGSYFYFTKFQNQFIKAAIATTTTTTVDLVILLQ